MRWSATPSIPAWSLSRLAPPPAIDRVAHCHQRAYATATSLPQSDAQKSIPKPGPPKPNAPFIIFDRNAKRLQRNRAAVKRKISEDGQEYTGDKGYASRQTDYVRNALAENVAERLLDVKRAHTNIVEIGSGPGLLRHFIDAKQTGTKKMILCDSSSQFARESVAGEQLY